jgi:predicted nucleic acid-binding protein
MSAIVFVDTNVLVYVRDAADPAKQAVAAEWMRRLWVEQRGRTSLQVLCEYYTTVTRKLTPGLKPEDAWDDVAALLAWEPAPMDGALLRCAYAVQNRYRLSWWDSMIVAAAQLQDCTLLLTEDLQHDLVCDTVKICNPFAREVSDVKTSYAAAPTRVSRHRARGRPRRSAAAADERIV